MQRRGLIIAAVAVLALAGCAPSGPSDAEIAEAVDACVYTITERADIPLDSPVFVELLDSASETCEASADEDAAAFVATYRGR